jgi:hypothetical protein
MSSPSFASIECLVSTLSCWMSSTSFASIECLVSTLSCWMSSTNPLLALNVSFPPYPVECRHHPLLALNVSFPPYPVECRQQILTFAAIARWVTEICFYLNQRTMLVLVPFFCLKISYITYIWCAQFCNFLCRLLIFSAFAIIVDTVDGVKPRELQTLARFSDH